MKIIAVIFLLSTSFVAFAQDSKYTIVFLNKNPEAKPLTKEESSKIMEGHMANINAMAKDGRLVAAGPFDGGGGLFIMNSTSTDDISKWLEPDPGVQAKRWNIEMLPYKPQQGGVCLVNEPYEMTNYTFVRFDAVVSKSTASTFPQIIKDHNDYLKELGKTGNVITTAVFGDHDGGIIVMKGDVERTIFESDPGVQQGLLELTMKKLYIAKGAFCEK